MMRDAALGMVYLHTSRPVIIHHDLTPSNLLVNKYYNVKVGDFGVSRIITDKIVAGTDASRKNPICMAPEVLLQNPYGTASDVFSFGCCLWCICTLREPWGEFAASSNRVLMVLKAVVDEGCASLICAVFSLAVWHSIPQARLLFFCDFTDCWFPFSE